MLKVLKRLKLTANFNTAEGCVKVSRRKGENGISPKSCLKQCQQTVSSKQTGDDRKEQERAGSNPNHRTEAVPFAMQALAHTTLQKTLGLGQEPCEPPFGCKRQDSASSHERPGGGKSSPTPRKANKLAPHLKYRAGS